MEHFSYGLHHPGKHLSADTVTRFKKVLITLDPLGSPYYNMSKHHYSEPSAHIFSTPYVTLFAKTPFVS